MSITEKIKQTLAGQSLEGTLKIIIDGGDILSFDENGQCLDNCCGDADCTLSLSNDTLNAIATGDTDPMTAYFAGDLTITGDMGVAMSLASILKK